MKPMLMWKSYDVAYANYNISKYNDSSQIRLQEALHVHVHHDVLYNALVDQQQHIANFRET